MATQLEDSAWFVPQGQRQACSSACSLLQQASWQQGGLLGGSGFLRCYGLFGRSCCFLAGAAAFLAGAAFFAAHGLFGRSCCFFSRNCGLLGGSGFLRCYGLFGRSCCFFSRSCGLLGGSGFLRCYGPFGRSCCFLAGAAAFLAGAAFFAATAFLAGAAAFLAGAAAFLAGAAFFATTAFSRSSFLRGSGLLSGRFFCSCHHVLLDQGDKRALSAAYGVQRSDSCRWAFPSGMNAVWHTHCTEQCGELNRCESWSGITSD